MYDVFLGAALRSLSITVLGFLFWAVCMLTGRILSTDKNIRRKRATYSFIFLWFLLAAMNMWIGVGRAGYSIAEELPIFLMIFLGPTLPALFINRRFS